MCMVTLMCIKFWAQNSQLFFTTGVPFIYILKIKFKSNFNKVSYYRRILLHVWPLGTQLHIYKLFIKYLKTAHIISIKQGKPDEEQIDEFEEDLTLRIQKANRKLRHIPLIFVVLNAWGAWQEMASALSTTASWLVLMQVIRSLILTELDLYSIHFFLACLV